MAHETEAVSAVRLDAYAGGGSPRAAFSATLPSVTTYPNTRRPMQRHYSAEHRPPQSSLDGAHYGAYPANRIPHKDFAIERRHFQAQNQASLEERESKRRRRAHRRTRRGASTQLLVARPAHQSHRQRASSAHRLRACLSRSHLDPCALRAE
jgi:hypothetical protein